MLWHMGQRFLWVFKESFEYWICATMFNSWNLLPVMGNSFLYFFLIYVFMWFKWSQLSKRTNVSLHGVYFFFKLKYVVSVLIPQSSNLITLLKLISLVNICLCAGLKGLIRPGTCRPPGQYPSFCMKNLVKAEIRWKSTFIPVLNIYAFVRGVSCRQQDNLPFFKSQNFCLKSGL